MFIEYSPTQKGYKYYHPPFKKYFVSRGATFGETKPYFNVTQSPIQGESNENKEMTPNPVTSNNLIQGKSSGGSCGQGEF